MKKIINPCACLVYTSTGKERSANAFVEITYDKEGRLSLHGVIGPISGGNCLGSCGQCYDEIRKGIPTLSWTIEMLNKLCDIWDEWHLNDMRAYCQHQKELGWCELAKEQITIYNYRLTTEALNEQHKAERAALQALKNGEVFTPTESQTFFANLPYSVESYGKELNSPHYQPKKPLYPGDEGATRIERRGWIRFDKSEEGILCKPCPVCGYKYGSAWLKEEVPQEIIDWLFALPDTTVKPAWI